MYDVCGVCVCVCVERNGWNGINNGVCVCVVWCGME